VRAVDAALGSKGDAPGRIGDALRELTNGVLGGEDVEPGLGQGGVLGVGAAGAMAVGVEAQIGGLLVGFEQTALAGVGIERAIDLTDDAPAIVFDVERVAVNPGAPAGVGVVHERDAGHSALMHGRSGGGDMQHSQSLSWFGGS